MTALAILASPFPKLRQTLDLGEFHKDLAGNAVRVWLNVSDAFEERWNNYAQALKEAEARDPDGNLTPELQRQRAELYADLWDLEVDEVAELFATSGAEGLVAWMRDRTWEMVTDHRMGQAAKVPSG